MSQGKGSRPRPSSVDAETYRENFTRIFRRDRESGEAIRERLGPQRVAVTASEVGEAVDTWRNTLAQRAAELVGRETYGTAADAERDDATCD